MRFVPKHIYSTLNKFAFIQNDILIVQPFKGRLNYFINKVNWTYAKTMPEWPHEYIVRSKVDENLFVETIKHIREFGCQGSFYQKPITYFEEAGLVYWTMGAPINETTIINRCKKENSYEERLKNKTLPIRE
ncbi:MAG: hypothetical protein WCH01_05905 [Methylococcaceae bacterium]